jgi:leucyl-tRNA synthetase
MIELNNPLFCQDNVRSNSEHIVVMFPYPSGSGLHCGHWYNYALVDSYCRYKRFIGIGVFQPFGIAVIFAYFYIIFIHDAISFGIN